MRPGAPTDHSARQAAWVAERTSVSEPADLERLGALLGGRRAAVVVPARNEAATVGAIVEGLVAGQAGLPVEVLVVDDGSDDDTAVIAEKAGARVVRRTRSSGKGEAMRFGVEATSAEFVVFVDADVEDFRPYWAASLLLPLLRDEHVVLVKAAYDRPLTVDGVTHPGSGGRVTRLVAVPVLNLMAPELTVIAQPLAGETAARRDFLERTGFGSGYAVELGLLLDAYREAGLAGLAQVDLGVRAHRHRSDEALGRMATEILRLAADRAGWPTAAGPYAHSRRGVDGRWEHHTHREPDS